MTRTAAVLGASSYVGGFVVRKLLAHDWRVVAVGRRPRMLEPLFRDVEDRLTIAGPDDTADAVGAGPLSIVNLAYVQDAVPERLYRDSRQLIDVIEDLAAGRCTRLIQVSTVAVFGYSLATEPTPRAIRWRPMEDPYTDTKLYTEGLVERLAGRLETELAIVRLGAVIGPGSPDWIGRLGQRIMELEPVAYEGEPGFSNATDVRNVAAYLTHVLESPSETLRSHGAYHHLTELSAHRWPELLDVIAEAVGHPWIATRRIERPAQTRGLARRTLKAAYNAQAGAYARRAMSAAPGADVGARVVQRLRNPNHAELCPGPPVAAEDIDLLEVMSAQTQFRSYVVGDWRPAVDFPAACADISAWLVDAGYALEPGGGTAD